jgi:hypothetical protein
MKLFFIIFLFIFACDFALDPISNLVLLSKKINVINRSYTIDPTLSDSIYPIHTMLYTKISENVSLETKDSLNYIISLHKKLINVSSQAYFKSKDLIFSLNKNADKIKHEYFNFDPIYSEINDSILNVTFIRKCNFNQIINSNFCFIYSKDFSSFDIPIGNGKYSVFIKPTDKQYLIIPFIKFTHMQTDSINLIFWVNTSLNEIKSSNFSFELGNLTRFSDLKELNEY